MIYCRLVHPHISYIPSNIWHYHHVYFEPHESLKQKNFRNIKLASFRPGLCDVSNLPIILDNSGQFQTWGQKPLNYVRDNDG